MAVLGSSRDGAERSVEHKQCEAKEAKLEASFKASESKQSDAQQRVKELELIKDTFDKLVSKVNEAEKALGASQYHVQYLEKKLAKQSNQVFSKDGEATNERKRLSKLEGQVTSLSADIRQADPENATDKDLFEIIKTALALQKRASQKPISGCVKENDKLVADKATIDAEFREHRTITDTKLGRLQVPLENET